MLAFNCVMLSPFSNVLTMLHRLRLSVHHARRHVIICDEPNLLAASEMGFLWTDLTSIHYEWDTLSKTTRGHGNDMHLQGYTWQI